MGDIAASVLARLKNKAAKSGRSNQLYLQLFCQEEFLRRLEKSRFADNFVLKGGLLVYSITNFDARVSFDVDFMLRRIPNNPEQLRTVLEDIIAAPTGNSFVAFDIKNIVPLAIAKKYAGVRASLIGRIKNTRTPFDIDFGVGDVIVPSCVVRSIPTQLPDFSAPNVSTYSIVTIVAEKLDAILSLMEFSSRMKDYYDVYYLSNKFDFDGAVLTKALKETFKNRGRNFSDVQFAQICRFNKDPLMQRKWNGFVLKTDVDVADYETVLTAIENFLLPPFNAAVSGTEFSGQWICAYGRWES